MKELSIEQKAQRYDEAFKKAKNYHSQETECNVRIAMENLFPELVESEDEKIRKRLISYFKSQLEARKNDSPEVLFTYNKWIAWLEKPTTWNEDDEDMITDLSIIVHTYFSEISGIPFKHDLSEDKVRTWLKSLKDRIQLKQNKS